MKSKNYFNKIALFFAIVILTTENVAYGNTIGLQPPVEEKGGYQGITFFMSTTLSDIDNNGKGTEIDWQSEYRKPGIIRPGITPLFSEGGDSIYGLDFFPTIAKQSFDIMNNNNDVILKNVIFNNKKLEVGEYSTVMGVNYSSNNSSSYDNVLGYNTNMYSVYLGADRQVHEYVRLGIVGTFGQGDTDFKSNQSTREDTFFQGNAYLDYQSDEDLRFVSMLFFGKTKTDLKRRYSATLYDKDAIDNKGNIVNETAISDMDNYYFGVSNLIKKRYDIDKFRTSFYYEPKFEFNVSYMMQDSIHESTTSSDFDGLSLESKNTYSMITSFGISIGKDFILPNEKNLNLELSTTLFVELGDPYSQLTNGSNFNDRKPEGGLLPPKDPEYGDPTGNKNTIKGYDIDNITNEIALRGHYEINPLFNIYSGLVYIIGDKNRQTEIMGDLGVNYKF